MGNRRRREMGNRRRRSGGNEKVLVSNSMSQRPHAVQKSSTYSETRSSGNFAMDQSDP